MHVFTRFIPARMFFPALTAILVLFATPPLAAQAGTYYYYTQADDPTGSGCSGDPIASANYTERGPLASPAGFSYDPAEPWLIVVADAHDSIALDGVKNTTQDTDVVVSCLGAWDSDSTIDGDQNDVSAVDETTATLSYSAYAVYDLQAAATSGDFIQIAAGAAASAEDDDEAIGCVQDSVSGLLALLAICVGALAWRRRA
jgi:hypothetical protein